MSISTVVYSEEIRRKRAMNSEPKPCKSGIICDDEDDYPKEVVEMMIKQNRNLLDASPNLQNVEEIDNNTTGTTKGLCDSRTSHILLRKAQNIDGVWRYILNDGNQFYHVEVCSQTGVPCNFSDYIPSGYAPVCKQKYLRLRLQAVVRDRTVQDEFLIPSCCYCSITSTLSSV